MKEGRSIKSRMFKKREILFISFRVHVYTDTASPATWTVVHVAGYSVVNPREMEKKLRM